ncbi:MAG TPA: pyridoxal 5'-phosphate synthase glutaminase subunit PdxT [Myxococcota bacterium]|nr:pyridoxal 5'-phosphate synthase glutaminase subunit PdxT [Myxococcota bacterium]
MKVGVLAIQGDFAAHARALARACAEPFAVRTAAELARADALVLPGGESTAMLRGIARDGLEPALRGFVASGKPVLGTCAGAILLAREVCSPPQRSLGALDVAVQRNAYGTQLDSFVCTAEVDDPRNELAGLECVLIRAPRIVRTGPGVRVHARVKGDPALVSQGAVFAATFHPELTDDPRVYALWLRSATPRA